MDAKLEQDGPRYTLGLERRLAHSPEKVWRVLTERELLGQWFPCDVEGEWKPGAKLVFTFLHGEGEGLPEEDLHAVPAGFAVDVWREKFARYAVKFEPDMGPQQGMPETQPAATGPEEGRA